MNRSKRAVSLTLLSLLSLLIVTFIVRTPSRVTLPPTVTEGSPLGTSSARPEAVSETVAYSCEAGKSVLELLRNKVDNNLEVKTYSFGAMVESINGVKGGIGNKYWLYFVDGKSATVSADTYRCREGEPVEWKFTSDSGM